MFSKGSIGTAAAIVALTLASAAQAAAPAKLHLDSSGDQNLADCPKGASFQTNCIELDGVSHSAALGKYKVSVTLVIVPVLHKGWKSSLTGSISSARGKLTLTGNNAKDPGGYLVYTLAARGTGALAKAHGSGTLNFYGNLRGNGDFLFDATIQNA